MTRKPRFQPEWECLMKGVLTRHPTRAEPLVPVVDVDNRTEVREFDLTACQISATGGCGTPVVVTGGRGTTTTSEPPPPLSRCSEN
jgi:hypothetical protein